MRFEDLGESFYIVESPSVVGKCMRIKFVKTCALVLAEHLWIDFDFGSQIDTINPVLICLALSAGSAVRIGKKVISIKCVAEGHSLIERDHFLTQKQIG